MNQLPDELLCSIFKYTIQDINQLLILQLVNKKFQRLTNNGYLWYYAIKKMYPKWINQVQYAHDKQPLTDWKQFALKIYKQKNFITSKFDLKNILFKKKLDRSYHIKEPIISDIDPITNTGIIAISKSAFPTRHKILFYNYPNYTLLRKLELQFTIDIELTWTCQIICMQTIQINNEKVRLFAISLNEPTTTEGEQQSFWKNIIIYRLYDNGSTTCLANLNTNLLGRGAWFFSTINNQEKEWLQLISPDINYDQKLFLMIFGLGPHQFEGLVQLMTFDITTNHILSDPSKTIYQWNGQDFIISPKNKNISTTTTTIQSSAHTITTFYLEARVSCMVHFSHIKELEHLIITGNFHGEDLSIYDWRFGIKVGVLSTNTHNQSITAQPWGLEYTFAITPPPILLHNHRYGPRLIVVGDCQDKFEIKVWDISFLLNIKWNPFDNTEKVMDKQDIPQGMINRMYKSWWDKKTTTLEQLAINLYNGDMERLPYTTTLMNPYVHLLQAQVKYIAYINLNTFIYLLQEDGILSVMDIESGNILTTIDTGGKAEDVNVIGNNEIVITRKLELKRCILPQ